MSVRTWRYHLRNENHEGWAIAFLDEIGCFTVLSDYGTFGNRWPEKGWGPGDFREFFLQAGDDYVLSKIAGRDEYDADATLDAVKRAILEQRRSGMNRDPVAEARSKRRARIEWDLLEDHGDLDFERDFDTWTEATNLDEPWSYHCVSPPDDAKMFIAKVMPRLRKAIQEQLDGERSESRSA